MPECGQLVEREIKLIHQFPYFYLTTRTEGGALLSSTLVPSQYYRAGDERAKGVQDLFSAIALRYDLVNDLQSLGLHRLWKRRLVRLAQVTDQVEAVDLCCGTGDLAFALAAAGARRVIGLDFSAAMLDRARVRLASRKAGLRGTSATGPSIEFIEGDVLRLPFEDSSFDLLTVGYGLRNLADLDVGLREMRRVSRSGARLLVLEFGRPPGLFWRALYFGYLGLVVPLFGALFFGDRHAYSYILQSLQNYPAQEGLPARLEAAHWEHLKTTNLLGGIMSITEARAGA